MGCDFDLFVQARMQGQWHTWFYGQTRTRCGGFPLRQAACKLQEQCPNVGCYHAGELVACLGCYERLQELRAEVENELMQCEDDLARPSQERAGLLELQRLCEQRLTHYHGLMLSSRGISEREAMLFSVAEFEQYLHVLQMLEAKNAENGFRCSEMLYFKTLNQVPVLTTQLSMAGSIVEECGDYGIWLPDGDTSKEEVMHMVMKKRCARAQEWHSNLRIILKPLELPMCVTLLLANFSAPAVKMRIVLYDDEGQMERVRKKRL